MTTGYNPVSSHAGTVEDVEEKQDPSGAVTGERKMGSSSEKHGSFFSSPVAFAALVMSASTTWLTGLTYLGGTVSTIEKRLQLKSSESGLIPVTNDCFGLCTLLFIIHFGQRRHRPRIIAVLYLITGLGYLMHTIPHFIYQLPYSLRISANEKVNGTDHDGVCNLEQDDLLLECDVDRRQESGPLWGEAMWIILGQALCSCGTPAYPLFIAYLDDGVHHQSMALYIGVLSSTVAIGAAMGYGLATLCLHLPNYLFMRDFYIPTSPYDPRYLGNWWLGFLIIGTLLIFLSIPLWFFPRLLPKQIVDNEEEGMEEEEKSDDYVAAVTQGLKSFESQSSHGFLRGLFLSVWRITSNGTVICLILATTALSGFIAGFQIFGAKYIQYQFSFEPDFASILFGLLLVPAGIFGNILSGFIVKRFAQKRYDMAKMIVISALVCLFLSPITLFLGCQNKQIACLTNFGETNSSYTPCLPELTSPCNEKCKCPVQYDPVCGTDKITYASPCHAGCTDATTEEFNGKNRTVYANCACISHSGFESNLEPLVPEYDAVEGECSKTCILFIPYVIVMAIIIMAGIMCVNPVILLEIRSVESGDRSMTIAVGNFLGKIFGYIPGPLYYGAIIDTACILFQKSCGKTGNCLVYDVTAFRHSFNGVSLALQFAAIVFVLIAFYSIKRQPGSKRAVLHSEI